MDGHSTAPHSPHARVRVVNISQYDAQSKSKEHLMSDDACLTPKKQPARIIFKEAGSMDDKCSHDQAAKVAVKAGFKDALPIPNPNEEALSDFLNRVAIANSRDSRKHHQQNSPLSPSRRHSPPAFALLPDYVRYQEAMFQRTLSTCNSFSKSSPSTPGVEWVDHRSSPRSLQNTLDAQAMLARHAIPPNIFCSTREELSAAAMAAALHQEYGYYHSTPPSPSDMSRDLSFHDYIQRRSRHPDDRSIPNVAAVSPGSSASWSEEEEKRQFLDYMSYMSHGQSFARQMYQKQQLSAAAAAAVEEESRESSMVEIAPGLHEPLRKADETVRAVRQDFYVPLSCFGCSQDIFCIADAKYVICPTCRVVSPIEEGALDGQVLKQHGLGLGFTCESLFQIQSDILLER